VIEACQLVQERSQSLVGMTIVSEPPLLRHFTARFAPLQAAECKPLAARWGELKSKKA
jgi:hypothetical protein